MPSQIVESGYAKDKRKFVVRDMTLAELLMQVGSVNILDVKGKLRQVKINGSAKTWVRRPLDCKLPYKYGLYEYGYIEFENGSVKEGSPVPVVILEEVKE